MKSEKGISWTRLLFPLLLAGIVVLLLISTIGIEEAPEGKAVATKVDGTVTLFSPGSARGNVIRENDIVGKNDRLEVQEKSRLELRCPDGSFLRLSEKTGLTVRLLQFQQQSSSMSLQVVLDSGKLWYKMRKPAIGSRMEVLTDTAFAAAEDAVLAVDREEDASTAVRVYEGGAAAAALLPPGGGQGRELPIAVNTYQEVSVAAGAGISQVRDFDPKATINDWIRWNLQRDAREGLVSVTVSPDSSVSTRGASRQLTGTAHYPDNVAKDVTWFATWGSTDADVAAIDQAGRARAGKPGNSKISAAIVDISGSGMFTVSPELVSIAVTPASPSIVNGAVLQFNAQGKFSDNTEKDVTSSVAWTSVDAGIAVINKAGLATAGNKAGMTVISASLSNKTASARLTVKRELVSLAITPDGATVMEGQSRQFKVLANFSDKTTKDVTSTVKWHISDPLIAVVNGSGLVTGKSEAGTASITASFHQKTASGTVTVIKPAPVPAPAPRTLVSLSVQPTSVSIRQMMSQQFTATGNYSDGSTQDLTQSVVWTSQAPLLAQVKSTGKALAIKTGTIEVAASYGGRSGSAKLTVLPREIYRPRADAETAKKFVYWPEPRFSKAHGAPSATGALVIDGTMNLIWPEDAASPGPSACSPGVPKKWQGVADYITCLNKNAYLGYRNWRLPTREELFSILDYKQSEPNPRVYTEGFCYTQGFYGYEVWFSTNEGIPTYADIGLGVGYYTEVSKSFYVWPVRSLK